jgi:hypothetical protein
MDATGRGFVHSGALDTLAGQIAEFRKSRQTLLETEELRRAVNFESIRYEGMRHATKRAPIPSHDRIGLHGTWAWFISYWHFL